MRKQCDSSFRFLTMAGIIFALALGFLISPLAEAEVITGKELVLKGKVLDTGYLRHMEIMDDIVVGGGYYNDHLRIFDVSDPTSPLLAYSHPLQGKFTGIRSSGSQIYYSHYTNSPRDGWLDIMDVTDPYSPTLLCHYLTRDVATGLDLKTPDIVVLSEDDAGISVLDVSDRSNPVVIDTHYQRNADVVRINGDIAAIFNATTTNYQMVLYDISDEYSLSRLGSASVAGKLREMVFNGSIGYLALEDAGVEIFDISNPSSPVLMSSLTGIGVTVGVDIVGTTLYVASDELLRIYDVTDPSSPTLQLSRQIEEHARSVKVIDSLIYVGTEDSLQIFELQDAKEKELVLKKTVANTQQLRYLAFTGDVLVGGGYLSDKMQFFDIADPLDPKLAYSHLISEHSTAIVANGSYIYGGHSTGSPRQGWLDIFDVTDPYSPEIVCHYSARDLVGGIDFISPNVLLLADDDAGLSILDVSNFNDPVVIDTQSQLNSQRVHISGDYAAIGDTTIGNNRVCLYDISSKTDIGYVGSISIPSRMRDMEYKGSTIYAAQSDAGVVIVDASDPTNPVLISTISGIGTVWSLDVVGSTLYVASSLNLYIYDVTDPASPVKLYECPTDGEALGVIVKDSIIYVGTDDSLQVFELQAKDPSLSLSYSLNRPFAVGSTVAVSWKNDVDIAGTAVKFELWNKEGWVADFGYDWNPKGEGVEDVELPDVAAGDYWIRMSSTWDPRLIAYGETFTLQVRNAVRPGHWLVYE